MAYCDDLLIFSNSIDKHYEHLKAVFEHVKNANLTLNLEKSQIAMSEISYLGLIISVQGVKPDPN